MFMYIGFITISGLNINSLDRLKATSLNNYYSIASVFL